MLIKTIKQQRWINHLKIVNFILVVPCIVNLLYVSNHRDAVLSSLFIIYLPLPLPLPHSEPPPTHYLPYHWSHQS